MLSDNEIVELMESERMDITDINIQEQITPVGIDLTVGPSYRRPATQEVLHAESNNGRIVLDPGSFYHLHTVESIQLPDTLYGRTEVIMERSLEGVRVTTGMVEPGFDGQLMLGVENVSETAQTLEVGDRIVHLNIHELKSKPDETYEGETHFDRNLDTE